MTARPWLLLRKDLNVPVKAAPVPVGHRIRTLVDGDERAVHALLSRTYAEAGDALPLLPQWWAKLSRDAEFSADLCFLAVDARGKIAGVAQCWTSSFLKDLAVRADARRLGLGEALLTHCFAVFQARGAGHLDLKVEVDNPTGALRLYERCGMKVVA
ncbi:MAG: GNAT family N-acetyltransferase [Mesorhizobium sp.]